MKYQKIVLAGGNGYLGNVLTKYYQSLSKEIIILSRKPQNSHENIRTLVWDGKTKGDWVGELDGADVLINLCGKNVSCRYTPKNQQEILSSRILPTQVLGESIQTLLNPPKLWINFASATIYRHAEDRPQDEDHGEIGRGFSIEVCTQWEECFFKTLTPKTRKIALRTSIVLGNDDGAFPRLVNLSKLGLGGKQGNGKQFVSWIHELDVARCTEWLIKHTELDGIINCTSPYPIRNQDFMALIRRSLKVPLGIPTPAWLLEIGAQFIGTETELILKSRWVLPSRLRNAGFSFQFENAKDAIGNLIQKPLKGSFK